MSLAKSINETLSEEEYLQDERLSEIKHEYIDGYIYAMIGASRNHNRITRNVISGFDTRLKQSNSPCETFSSDMKVKVRGETTRFFYPDVMVVCNTEDNDSDYYESSPIIIVEVLSESTEKLDTTTKFNAYKSIPTLEEYVLIEQYTCRTVVLAKANGWQPAYYYLGDSIRFESIDVSLSVEEIYYKVENEDILAFLKEINQ